MLLVLLLAAVESQPLTTSASAVVNLSELASQPWPATSMRVLPRPLRWENGVGAPAGGPWSMVPQSAGVSPSPVKTFTGLLDNNTADPPDTDGAVGPNHVVTAINTSIQVQDRTGTVLGSVPVQQFCTSVLSAGQFVSDPHVWYDPSADRFLFAIDGVTTNGGALSAPGGIIIGATQTGDPTGNWSLFQVKDPSSTLFLDYPTMGFNGQWVVVGANMFPLSTGNGESHLFVFDKSKLYAGQNPAINVFTGIPDFTLFPAVTYDSGVGPVYIISDANGAAGQLHLSEVTGAVGSPTFTSGGAVSTGTTWDDAPASGAGAAFAPELGGGTLDCNDARIINAVYKNGALWASHTIFLPPGAPTQHAAAQWVQVVPGASITQNVTATQVGSLEDTSGKYDYCFDSIAVNQNGDTLVGGTRFSADSYPSSYYALHLSADPPGALRDPDVYQAGAGAVAKGGGDTRWGDYSVTDVDPDGVTFWTLEEAGAGGNLWGTYWAHVDPGTGSSSGGGGGGILGLKGCGCDLTQDAPGIGPALLGLIGLIHLAQRRTRGARSRRRPSRR